MLTWAFYVCEMLASSSSPVLTSCFRFVSSYFPSFLPFPVCSCPTFTSPAFSCFQICSVTVFSPAWPPLYPPPAVWSCQFGHWAFWTLLFIKPLIWRLDWSLLPDCFTLLSTGLQWHVGPIFKPTFRPCIHLFQASFNIKWLEVNEPLSRKSGYQINCVLFAEFSCAGKNRVS